MLAGQPHNPYHIVAVLLLLVVVTCCLLLLLVRCSVLCFFVAYRTLLRCWSFPCTCVGACSDAGPWDLNFSPVCSRTTHDGKAMSWRTHTWRSLTQTETERKRKHAHQQTTDNRTRTRAQQQLECRVRTRRYSVHDRCMLLLRCAAGFIPCM